MTNRPVLFCAAITAALAAATTPAWARGQTIRVYAQHSAREGCTLVQDSLDPSVMMKQMHRRVHRQRQQA